MLEEDLFAWTTINRSENGPFNMAPFSNKAFKLPGNYT